MTGLEIATWAVAVAAILGLIATWIKNGRSQAKRDGKLEANQKNIINQLEDPETGLSAINEKCHRFETHCATVSTALDGRVTATERDIKELKQKAAKE